MNDENDLFIKQMKGVKPIKKNNKTNIKKKPIVSTKVVKQNITTKRSITPVAPENNTKKSQFLLEKVSIGKNIKKNFFRIDKKIDFHGKSLLEAEEAFSSTILECFNKDKRCLLFVTGKGLFKIKNYEESYNPKLYHGVIRSAFFTWVKSKKFSKHILSFEQASIEHGGDGAFYVYLRKKKN